MDTKKDQIPKCVGVIMDGNRRWAKAQGMAPYEGHTAGYARLKDFLGWAKNAEIANVIVYAFSTENWKRTEEEVAHILNLLTYFMAHEAQSLCIDTKDPIRMRFLGDRSLLPEA